MNFEARTAKCAIPSQGGLAHGGHMFCIAFVSLLLRLHVLGCLSLSALCVASCCNSTPCLVLFSTTRRSCGDIYAVRQSDIINTGEDWAFKEPVNHRMADPAMVLCVCAAGGNGGTSGLRLLCCWHCSSRASWSRPSRGVASVSWPSLCWPLKAACGQHTIS